MELDLTADYIDIRDIIARVEELEILQSEYEDGGNESPWEDVEGGLADEFDMLNEILSELRGRGGDHQWRGDWYPVTLIRDSHFEDYCDECLEDWGIVMEDLPSFVVIDREATAENMKADYSSVEIDGTEYWYR